MKLENIMLDDLIYVKYKNYGELEDDLETFLKDNKNKVVNDYKQAEEDGVSMYNSVEVRTQILKDNLITDGDLEDSEDYSIVYQDINLEAIAEILQEVTIADLESQLSHYGPWQIHLKDELHILVDFS